MHRLFPPLCLVLALAMAVAGFALLAVGRPEPNVDLHRATAAGDEQSQKVLESQLQRERLERQLLLGCLFAGSAVMIATAFVTMKPTSKGSNNEDQGRASRPGA